MDRSWINARRITDEYQNGVEQFLEFAQQNRAYLNGKFYCPCVNCLNGRRRVIDEIRDHIICDGFLMSYTTWIWHGEDKETQTVAQTEQADVEMEDQIEDMIHDVGQEFFQQEQSHVYDTLKSDSETPLFPDCTTFTQLSTVLRLMNLKAKYGWSDKSFTNLLELLKLILPKDNTLPDRHYEAKKEKKKVLCSMGLQYKKIHAFPNDCILYRKEFESLHKCPRYGLSRYKVKDDGRSSDEDVVDKGPPAKVLWYLPIIPRFKRLFANATDAMNLIWHADNRNCDGILCHPADSP
uniref:Transposase-associated domain-containing protein n=1 Tax=Cajanus cajan TaxID=3821 RepID=A0A151UF66_CAJCA